MLPIMLVNLLRPGMHGCLPGFGEVMIAPFRDVLFGPDGFPANPWDI
jgi:hypothetical protein